MYRQRSQGKNPGYAPLKMPAEERQQMEKSKNKVDWKKENPRGGHGQTHHMLHRRNGQKKTKRSGNVEATSDLQQSSLPEGAGKKSQCIPVNAKYFNQTL